MFLLCCVSFSLSFLSLWSNLLYVAFSTISFLNLYSKLFPLHYLRVGPIIQTFSNIKMKEIDIKPIINPLCILYSSNLHVCLPGENHCASQTTIFNDFVGCQVVHGQCLNWWKNSNMIPKCDHFSHHLLRNLPIFVT